MLERGANRREQHDGHRFSLTTVSARCTDGVHAVLQGLGHHHHARAAAKGTVIHTAVVALGVITRIPQMHGHLPGGIGTTRHTTFQKWGKQLGEQGDDVKAHVRWPQ